MKFICLPIWFLTVSEIIDYDIMKELFYKNHRYYFQLYLILYKPKRKDWIEIILSCLN